jgi:hypothetical protein
MKKYEKASMEIIEISGDIVTASGDTPSTTYTGGGSPFLPPHGEDGDQDACGN